MLLTHTHTLTAANVGGQGLDIAKQTKLKNKKMYSCALLGGGLKLIKNEI
jgi:hypothetical protein